MSKPKITNKKTSTNDKGETVVSFTVENMPKDRWQTIDNKTGEVLQETVIEEQDND